MCSIARDFLGSSQSDCSAGLAVIGLYHLRNEKAHTPMKSRPCRLCECGIPTIGERVRRELGSSNAYPPIACTEIHKGTAP